MPSLAANGGADGRRPAKVFGIGLSRTGTTSLTHALIALGYRALHFPFDADTQREIAAYLESGAEAIELSILGEYDALADIPICCTYQGLDHAYPGSRFILTVRDKASWLDSVERFWEKLLEPVVSGQPEFITAQYIGFLQQALVQQTLGSTRPDAKGRGAATFDREIFGRVYDSYHQQVFDFFRGREDQLLVLNIVGGEGWEKLAPFLGQPIPQEPFPSEMRLREPDARTADGNGSATSPEDRIGAVRAYIDAFRSRDLDSAVDCFAADAVLKFVDQRYTGQQSIAEWHRERFKAGATVEKVGTYEAGADRVTVELVVGSKVLKRWRVKFRGRAAFRLAGAKIQEMGLEDIRLVR
ncbi:MAG TPA: sulfotransferase [Thermomicrobiaceae bacterium]|nr:sulfotransferase [Thermomicrobiaceae bacterium]